MGCLTHNARLNGHCWKLWCYCICKIKNLYFWASCNSHNSYNALCLWKVLMFSWCFAHRVVSTDSLIMPRASEREKEWARIYTFFWTFTQESIYFHEEYLCVLSFGSRQPRVDIWNFHNSSQYSKQNLFFVVVARMLPWVFFEKHDLYSSRDESGKAKVSIFTCR